MRNVGRTALVLVSLLSAGLSTVACTASDRPSTATNAASTPTAGSQREATSGTTQTSTTPSGPECTADNFKVDGDAGQKPTITVPSDCRAPGQLVSKDLIPGTGAEVKAGSTATVHYVLATLSDRKEREASWTSGQTFDVQNVGQAQVIEGWNEGLIGLKEGGRRLLVVPADKGYGERGNSGIKPGETLIFVIDATKVSG